MTSLKALKQRIKSVKSTQKITGAMKMVATSHLRRWQTLLTPYRTYVGRLTKAVARTMPILGLNETLPSLLAGRSSIRKHLIIVTSADRGLAGNFNLQLTARAVQHARQLQKKGQEVEIWALGKKVYNALTLMDNMPLRPLICVGFHRLTENVFDVAKQVVQDFEANDIDACTLICMGFQSILAQKIQVLPLIPALLKEEKETSPPLFGVEPSPGSFLEEMAPFLLSSRLLLGVMESKTSEEASRMMAMDNATRNANDMLAKLEILYNRTRQAQITKELIEIISGAEAL